MTLKALFIFGIGIGIGLFSNGISAEESLTLRKIRETGIVSIGFRDTSIPFSYLDKKQRPLGYSIDICLHIVDAVKTRLTMPNIEIKFVPVTSANRLSFVANDIVDLECGTTTNNAERQKTVEFSMTTFVVSNSFVTKTGSNIRSLEDLRGQMVVSTAGTTSIEALTQLNRTRGMNMHILAGKDHAESFLMVATDRAAAFVMDDVLLYGLVASAKNPSGYRVQQTGLQIEPYGIALKKDDPEFKKIADQTIIDLFKSGGIEKLYQQWFLSPIPPSQISLKLPMNSAFKRLIVYPTDSPNPADYR